EVASERNLLSRARPRATAAYSCADSWYNAGAVFPPAPRTADRVGELRRPPARAVRSGRREATGRRSLGKLDGAGPLRCKFLRAAAGHAQKLRSFKLMAAAFRHGPKVLLPDGEETPECLLTWQRRRRTPYGFWSSQRA